MMTPQIMLTRTAMIMMVLFRMAAGGGRGIVAKSTTIHYEMLSRHTNDVGEKMEEQQLCGDMPFAGVFRGFLKHLNFMLINIKNY